MPKTVDTHTQQQQPLLQSETHKHIVAFFAPFSFSRTKRRELPLLQKETARDASSLEPLFGTTRPYTAVAD